jgi:D-alanyl-D-alanine carboxypeptidase (penicillin-binding protein 5/6)
LIRGAQVKITLAGKDTATTAGEPQAETPGYVPRQEPPKVLGAAAVVCDAKTGRILYRKNADERRPVASTQKLMTALVLSVDGDFDEIVTVAKTDTEVEPSSLKISAGEKYTRREIFEGMLVRSGNDAAHCLARDNAGSCEAFAEKMNAMAKRLNMSNSHFVNPSGLPVEGQYSTARDMAKLAITAYRNPVISEVVSKKQLPFKHATSGRIENLNNTNKLLTSSSHCTGMKTGYTDAAGRCLIASGTKAGQEIIVVVLGSGSLRRAGTQIWKDAGGLLEWGLSELAPGSAP